MKLTRVELANIVGTVTEPASRLLSKFKEEGIIDMQGRRLKIIDHEALLEAANVQDCSSAELNHRYFKTCGNCNLRLRTSFSYPPHQGENTGS